MTGSDVAEDVVDGILYAAVGPGYVAEATASALSSLRFNAVPHAILCDTVPASSPAGIAYMPFAAGQNPFVDKIRAMIATPFERTLFLDTDTYVCGPLGELFDLMPRFDLAACAAAGYAKRSDPVGSEAFHDFNTGVVAYCGSDAMDRFLRDWQDTCEAWLRDPPFPDAARPLVTQPAFRRCVWAHALKTHVLPHEYNYRTIAPGRLIAPVKVIHGRSDDYPALVARLNARTGPRVFGKIQRYSAARRLWRAVSAGLRPRRIT